MKHKKLLIAVVVIVVILAMAAIGNYWDSKKPTPSSPPTPSTSEPASPAPADNPLMTADFMTSDVLNGFDEKIGEYGYIEIKKSDMEAVTAGQLTEFCQNKCDDSGLNFVSVLFEDGTGLHINIDSWFVAIPYGTIDVQSGQLSETLGYIEPATRSEDGTTPASYEYVSADNG